MADPVETRKYDDVAFASQEYIPWFIGSVRLGTKADFNRVKKGSAKVLMGHNGMEPVGRITSAKLDRENKVWRSNWEIPEIAANRDTLDRIDTGLLHDVSVGASFQFDDLKIDNEDTAESWDDLQFTIERWELVEESLTPIPADTSVGMTRDHATGFLAREDVQGFRLQVTGDGAIMTDKQSQDLRSRLESKLTFSTKGRTPTMPETITQVDSVELARAITSEIAQGDLIQRRVDELVNPLRLENTNLTQVVEELRAGGTDLAAKLEEEQKVNAEYRAKLDTIQFAGPGVMTLENRGAFDKVLDLGNILKLSAAPGHNPFKIDRTTSTLEESWMEQNGEIMRSDHPTPPNAIAQIPWAAMAERNRQIQEREQAMLQRNTMSSGAGVRPLDVSVIGNAGFILAPYSPIMSRMDVRFGVTGTQKVPYLSAQPTAGAVAEAAAITASTYTLTDTDLLPKTIAVGFEISSALAGVDDGTFMGIINQTIFMLLNGEVMEQLLDGGGTNEISGLWGTTSLPNTDYGANDAAFSRDDVLDWANNVRLSDTDGGMNTFVLSSGLWKLCEKEPYAGSGATVTSRFMLEMGMMEGDMALHYSKLAPASIVNPGLYFKADRIVVFFWGNSLTLQAVPVMAAKEQYKMCAEVNYGVVQPLKNVARIKQT